MSVPAAVSFEAVEAELEAVAGFAAAAGLVLDTTRLSETTPLFSVTFRNAKSERFYAAFDCRDYGLYPPTIEFTDASDKTRGLPAHYPNVFHPMPCVCMRYNRKAYRELGGPHGDWRLIDWHLATSGGGSIDSLAMIVSDLHSKILPSTGRLG